MRPLSYKWEDFRKLSNLAHYNFNESFTKHWTFSHWTQTNNTPSYMRITNIHNPHSYGTKLCYEPCPKVVKMILSSLVMKYQMRSDSLAWGEHVTRECFVFGWRLSWRNNSAVDLQMLTHPSPEAPQRCSAPTPTDWRGLSQPVDMKALCVCDLSFAWCCRGVWEQYLVFGVRRVHSLPVSTGLDQDANGVELQEDFTGHAVKERDVCQSCRGQQKHFTAGGIFTQIYTNITTFNSIWCSFFISNLDPKYQQHTVTGGSLWAHTGSVRVKLTDEGRDDVLHALQKAGEMLCGGVMWRRDLCHHSGRFSSCGLCTWSVCEDICQTQDPVHLHTTQTHNTSALLLTRCCLHVRFMSGLCNINFVTQRNLNI